MDPLVAAFFRTVPLVLAAWVLLLRELRADPLPRVRGRGSWQGIWPGWDAVWPLLVVGFIFNVTGNGGFQLALILAGLTISSPVAGGATLWGSALGGWWLLRERVRPIQAFGLILLMLALPLLTAGGGGGTGPVWLGAIMAAVAGLSFGSGNAIIRHSSVRFGLSPGRTLVPVTTSGLLCLFGLIGVWHGLAALTDVDQATLGWLLLAGCFNVVGLVSVTRALQVLPAARVGALGVLQTALAAAGGVLLFSEPFTASVAGGLLISVVGAILSQQRRRTSPAAPAPGTTLAPRHSDS